MELFHRHKRTLFPVVLVGLTLALAAFIYFTLLKPAPAAPAISTDTSQPPAISDEEYRGTIRAIISEFQSKRREPQSDLERLILIEQTLDYVLAVKVSAGYKDLHLGLATSLFQMAQGLRGEADTYAEGEQRFDQVLAENPWLP